MRSATKKRVQLRCVHECEDSMSWAIFDFIKARTGRRHDFDDSQQQRQGHESRISKKCIIWYTRLRPLSVRCIHDTFCGSSMSCKLGNIELYLWPVVFIWCLFALVYIYLLLSWVEKILLPYGFCHHCLFRKASHLWQEMAKSELIYYTQENTM